MDLQPLEDRIIVRADKPEEQRESGLIIPQAAQEKPLFGEVLAAGPGRYEYGVFVPLAIATGDRVLFSKFGGTTITHEGEELLVLTSRDVLARVSPAYDAAASLAKAPCPYCDFVAINTHASAAVMAVTAHIRFNHPDKADREHPDPERNPRETTDAR